MGPNYVNVCQDLLGPEYVNVCQDISVLNMSMCAKIYGFSLCQDQ